MNGVINYPDRANKQQTHEAKQTKNDSECILNISTNPEQKYVNKFQFTSWRPNLMFFLQKFARIADRMILFDTCGQLKEINKLVAYISLRRIPVFDFSIKHRSKLSKISWIDANKLWRNKLYLLGSYLVKFIRAIHSDVLIKWYTKWAAVLYIDDTTGIHSTHIIKMTIILTKKKKSNWNELWTGANMLS